LSERGQVKPVSPFPFPLFSFFFFLPDDRICIVPTCIGIRKVRAGRRLRCWHTNDNSPFSIPFPFLFFFSALGLLRLGHPKGPEARRTEMRRPDRRLEGRYPFSMSLPPFLFSFSLFSPPSFVNQAVVALLARIIVPAHQLLPPPFFLVFFLVVADEKAISAMDYRATAFSFLFFFYRPSPDPVRGKIEVTFSCHVFPSSFLLFFFRSWYPFCWDVRDAADQQKSSCHCVLRM